MGCLSYPTGFTVQGISPESNINKRYSLEISLDNSRTKKTATIIMMNPSKANQNCSDQTVNKVLNFFKDNSKIPISKVIILNLFPYYENDSKKLVNRIKSINSNELQENIDVFTKHISESDFIVLAWGNVPKGFCAKIHNAYVKKTMNIIEITLKQDILYVFKDDKFAANEIITKKQRPRHPNRITLNNLYKIQNYSYNRELLKFSFENNLSK
ncbi:TPA: DUF1643 domain-containing protein [Bacillus cereus]